MKNIAYCIGFGLLLSCGPADKPTDQPVEKTTANVLTLSAKQAATLNLETGLLEKKNIPETIKPNGVVDLPPQNRVSVSIALGGYVKSTHLVPGKPIRKGEVLAVMEDNQYIELQQEYLTIKAKLKQTQAEFARQQDLNQSKATSDKILQQVTAENQANRIALQALEEKLRLLGLNPQTLTPGNISRSIKLFAPFTGYVAQVNVNVGKYAEPSEVLFELVNPETLWLNLKVFENDIAALQPGQTVQAYTNQAPTKKYAGKVIYTGKALASDRSIEVHASLQDADNLIPGTYLNAEVARTNAETWAVPEAAVVNFEGKDFLFVAKEEKKFELLPAETGATHQGWTAIKNAEVFAGKKVVTKGAYALLMGLKNTGEAE